MKTFFTFLLLGLLSSQAVAQLDGAISMDENETVIEERWLKSNDLEEPHFPERKSERTVSSLYDEQSTETLEWTGHLSVVKEIPFSDPDLSRATVQLRALAELEASEKKNK